MRMWCVTKKVVSSHVLIISRLNYGIKEQMNTITNRYNKWLYLFHISSC